MAIKEGHVVEAIEGIGTYCKEHKIDLKPRDIAELTLWLSVGYGALVSLRFDQTVGMWMVLSLDKTGEFAYGGEPVVTTPRNSDTLAIQADLNAIIRSRLHLK